MALRSLIVFLALATRGEANQFCTAAVPLTCGSTVLGDTSNFTHDGTFDCIVTHSAAQAWYYVDVDAGRLDVSTCGSAIDWDSQISVYSGCNCSLLSCYQGMDDGCKKGLLTHLITPVTAGRYFIMVHGFNFAAAPYTLSVNCTPATAATVTPCPLGARPFATGLPSNSLVDLSESHDQSNSALYGLLALLAVLPAGAFLALRLRRRTEEPEMLEFDAPECVGTSAYVPEVVEIQCRAPTPSTELM